ncbi:RNA-directed DNA polymerase, eukaryota, reverse transcriptase zinc-binding domain protein [Tanacetum coccineum]
MNGRMETRSNLDKSGVDLDSVRCPLCDDGIEKEDHIFVYCKITKELWLDVLKWWGIPNVSFLILQDLVHLVDHIPLGEKFTKFFDVVVQTTIWSIWRYRNNVIFSSKKPSKDLIFNDIKMYSFNWIVNREDLKNKSQMVETASGKLAMPSGSASDRLRKGCDDFLAPLPGNVGIKRLHDDLEVTDAKLMLLVYKLLLLVLKDNAASTKATTAQRLRLLKEFLLSEKV